MPLRLSPEDIKQLGLKGIQVKSGQSKYRAVRTEYNGVMYASKAEANRARQLDADPLVAWWIGQVRLRLGCPENIYVPDFLVALRSNFLSSVVHAEDVKGMETAKFRRDKKLWKSYGPFPLWIIKGGKIEVIEGGRQ